MQVVRHEDVLDAAGARVFNCDEGTEEALLLALRLPKVSWLAHLLGERITKSFADVTSVRGGQGEFLGTSLVNS